MTTNKAKATREALGLTPTETGILFTGQTDKKLAYDTWSRWERTGNWPAPAEKLLNVILALKMAEQHKTRNCHGALSLVMILLQPDDGD